MYDSWLLYYVKNDFLVVMKRIMSDLLVVLRIVPGNML